MNKEIFPNCDTSIDKMKFKYKEALNNLERMLNSLDSEYSNLGEDNPIEHIKIRIKSEESIKGKLQRKEYELFKKTGEYTKLEFNEENIEKYISDVVGARIVCPFLNDVERVIERIKKHPELRFIKEKDYINEKKVNGYASYHMKVLVPVAMDNELTYVKAEIQIRTIAMDMWASLEHKLFYKKGIQLSQETSQNLRIIADKTSNFDKYLNEKYLQEKRKMKPIQKEKLQAEEWFSNEKYNELQVNYMTALEKVKNEIIHRNETYKLIEQSTNETNPIEHIKYRIKPRNRMITKLQEKGKELSISSLEENINDIAGIRIVCSFKSDLYRIINIVKNNLGFEVIKEKNYLGMNRKESGYAGYHLIVSVPIYCEDGKVENKKVEIQIRTIAMDMWASLEHKLGYRRELDEETKKELRYLANERELIDNLMENTLQESKELIQNKKKVKKICP